METSLIDIYIEDDKNRTFMIECPKSIGYLEFEDILKEKNILRPDIISYYIIFGEKIYNKYQPNEILNFNNNDTIIIINTTNQNIIVNQANDLIPNINDEDEDIGDIKIPPLSGFLRFNLIKYISNFIKDLNLIKSKEVRDIIIELRNMNSLTESPKGPEEDIILKLSDTTGNNFMLYSRYVCSIISNQDINNLLQIVDQNMRNIIIEQSIILSKYEEINKNFEKSLEEYIKNSYFDYSLINFVIHPQSNLENYLKSMSECPNLVKRYLFHGTQIEPISKIITNGFKYPRKTFFGMGIGFSDMLDYISFYCGGKDLSTRREFFGKTLPVNTPFSCVGAEVYFSKDRIKYIFDYSYYVDELDHFPTYDELKTNYRDKMVNKYGVHIASFEPKNDHDRKKEKIIRVPLKGKFIGTDYIITEKNQILPLYGLTFKRNEYFILWRDPNFSSKNIHSDLLKMRQLFIYKYTKMNVYFESSIEKALEIIKRKRFNKIILISNIGLDLSGKKFVEIARKILGFDVVVLFFSQNQKHFSWLQNFPNALYTNDNNFYKEYIMNYNYEGLINLKNKIQNYYKIKLIFTNEFLKFPKFINQQLYSGIIFNEPCPYFKKVLIKLRNDISILFMNQNAYPSLISPYYIDNSYYWYITMIGNEITFYSNGRYLGADLQKRMIISDQFMQRFIYTKVAGDNKEYIFYYENNNNILTAIGNNVILQKYTGINQIFVIIEYY